MKADWFPYANPLLYLLEAVTVTCWAGMCEDPWTEQTAGRCEDPWTEQTAGGRTIFCFCRESNFCLRSSTAVFQPVLDVSSLVVCGVNLGTFYNSS
jgi:hypothetical protein